MREDKVPMEDRYRNLTTPTTSNICFQLSAVVYSQSEELLAQGIPLSDLVWGEEACLGRQQVNTHCYDLEVHQTPSRSRLSNGRNPAEWS